MAGTFQIKSSLENALLWASNPAEVLNLAHDAIIICDAERTVQFWNRGACETYGWAADEALGANVTDLLRTKFFTDHAEVEFALRSKGHWQGELRHTRKDGSEVITASRQAVRRDENGKPVFILEINRDITENWRRRKSLKLLHDVALATGEARSIEDAAEVCLGAICREVGWCAGHVYLMNTETGSGAGIRDVWFYKNAKCAAIFRAFCELRPAAFETSVAGLALKADKPVWTTDMVHAPEWLAGLAAQAGLATAFGMAVPAGNNILVAFEFFLEQSVEQDGWFETLIAGVGNHMARVFERTAAQEAHRRLSVTLLRTQDEERRRISRELHDEIGQYLSGVRLCLNRAVREAGELAPAAAAALEEAGDIVERCVAETRTLSQLLHPPLLDELGLASATRWYAEGFASRSGVKLDLRISPAIGRLDDDIELALFRVIQESLNNIHRHSGSQTATIKIELEARRVRVEIGDQGKGMGHFPIGMPAIEGPTAGVGITGMRERMKDLGGTLDIFSDDRGTTVRAIAPLRGEAAIKS